MKKKRFSVAALIGVCCLFLGFSYFWNQKYGDQTRVADTSSDQSATSQSDEGTVLPPGQQVAAPDFSLPDVQTGQSTQLSSVLKTEPVVFSFWATWCGPCNMELPVLNQLRKKYNGRVSFYGINSNDDPATIRKFVAAKGFSIPMLGDAAGTVANAYSVGTIPRLVVVGTDGKIKYQMDGFDPDEENYLPSILDQVLGENRT